MKVVDHAKYEKIYIPSFKGVTMKYLVFVVLLVVVVITTGYRGQSKHPCYSFPDTRDFAGSNYREMGTKTIRYLDVYFYPRWKFYANIFKCNGRHK